MGHSVSAAGLSRRDRAFITDGARYSSSLTSTDGRRIPLPSSRESRSGDRANVLSGGLRT